jgi:hypothetical protein
MAMIHSFNLFGIPPLSQRVKMILWPFDADCRSGSWGMADPLQKYGVLNICSLVGCLRLIFVKKMNEEDEF